MTIFIQYESTVTGAGEGAFSVGTDLITVMCTLRTLIDICILAFKIHISNHIIETHVSTQYTSIVVLAFLYYRLED